ncbi:MAG: metallophosphoesterase [bacterium]|nr:metallophosphoesterase [bacterium]
MENLKLIAIGDIHYGKDYADIPERRIQYGRELLERVIRRFRYGDSPDIILILGDILDGMDQQLLIEIRNVLDKTKIPVVAIPGNHDTEYERFFQVMEDKAGARFINDFIIYSFSDTYGEGDICSREKEDLQQFMESVKKYPDKKFIVIQHNPVYPEIENSYPYNLANAEEVHKYYKDNNVILSISGHYHKGQELACKDGVYYLTTPALCEEPFRYVEVVIENSKITSCTRQIKNPIPLCDNHCHTQFAYCAEDITIEKILERAELLGMGYVCFTEHADQLYLTKEEYNKALSYYQPDIIKRKRVEGKDRMALFKETVNKAKSDRVKVGLEVTPDKNGGISLLPEDREGIDILVGAIHFLPEDILSAASSERESWFMDMLEALIENGIDVLAHPFRIFPRYGLVVPETLFKSVVDILKSYNVAAELNFHCNNPEPEFFSMCLEEGIKISLGTDTHNLLEAGEFYPHLRFLKKLGVLPDILNKILYLIP